MAQKGLFPEMETIGQFRQVLLMSLSKFADTDTTQTGHAEIRELMTVHITNTERMNCFLSSLAESNEYMKSHQKKEYIRLYGEAASIFEDSLLSFVPKILGFLLKKLKDPDTYLQNAISDSVGMLAHHCLKNLHTKAEKYDGLQDFFKAIYKNMNSADKKV
jgi:hypothetical protein